MSVRRRLLPLLISSLTVLCLTAPAAGAQSNDRQQDSTTASLVGTWRLESMVERRPDGQRLPSSRYGPNVAGLLVYDRDGHMMAQLMNPDRPRFAGDSPTRGTPDEVKAAFDGYNAYYGTWSVDAQARTIRHRVTGNLYPNAVGTEFLRTFALDGDRLTLELPPARIQGEERTVQLVWRRAR